MARRFTEDEKRSIIEDYQNGIRPYQLAEKYGRDGGTIIGMLKHEGVHRYIVNRLSEEDKEFLRIHYPSGNYEAIMARFPNMTRTQIQATCSRHGIHYNDPLYWTESDLNFIKDHYYDYSAQELSDLIENRHTADAIETKALRKFGYTKDRTWSNDEIDILKEYYPKHTLKEVCDLLPKRTWQAISRKASLLGIRSKYTLETYWKQEEVELLLDHWESMTDADLAVLLNKDIDSVKQKRWTMGLLHFHHYNDSSYESLAKYLRGKLYNWKLKSMQNCNYMCVLTGDKDFEVHHLYSFSSILCDTIEKYNIKLTENFADYTPEYLDYIQEKFLYEHDKYPLGICIRKDIHKKFHQQYGKICTEEMWNEFIEENYKKEKAS